MKPDMRNIDEVVHRYLPSASEEQMDLGGARVLRELRKSDSHASNERSVDSRPAPLFAWRWIAMASAVAAVLLIVFLGAVGVWRQSAPAVVESVDGGLYRVVEGEAQSLQVNQRLEMGETIHSNGGAGATLLLADGSRIEMRTKSELSLERVDDGVRIHLSNGDIIVTAAKQPAGRHLYVQTKDVTVSVVGTVFLVNAEEEGSRVAVIEGEVRVRQKSTAEERLRPGDQMTTNPKMESLPVKEEIAWSRQAEAHMAVLRQAVVLLPAQNRIEPREAFVEVSIRPAPPAAGGGGRGNSAGVECSNNFQVDPSRFAIRRANVYTLAAMAYARSCLIARQLDLISGGPEWIRSDRFDIEALMPPNFPSIAPAQLARGEAPRLEKMLQTLLADYFKLVLHRQTKEMPGYVLTRGIDESKLKPWTGPMTVLDPDANKEVERGCQILGNPDEKGQVASFSIACEGTSLSRFLQALQFATSRPVLDRTALTGVFDLKVKFAASDYTGAFPSGLPSVSTAIREEFGLKLDAARVPVEVVVIDSAEKPSEN